MIKKELMQHPITKEQASVIPNTLTWYELRHQGYVRVADVTIIKYA